MKVYLLALLYFVFAISCFTQNLVPNPSFEDMNFCPTAINVYLDWGVKDWEITPSVDHYHPCANNMITSVPENFNGYQIAKDGAAYVGLIVFNQNIINPTFTSREYLFTRLLTSLEKDSFYVVKLSISLADESRFACDCIELWFTNEPPPAPPDDFAIIGGYPQLKTFEAVILKDSINWTELCWIFQAKGGEQYITIGNFEQNSSVSFEKVNESFFNDLAYYYIDDISVEKIPYHLTSIRLGDDYTVCDPELQDTLSVQGQAYHHFLWNTGDTTRSLVAKEPGMYWVEASIDGCFIRDTILIREEPKLTLDLGDDLTLCPGETATLSAGNPFDQYLWNTGATGANIQVSNYGSYWVTASYLCGTLTDTVSILQPSALAVALPNDTAIYLGEAIELLPAVSGVPAQYEWQPPAGLDCTDCPAPFARPLSSTLYILTVEDGYGCRATDSMSVSVEFGGRVYAPSAFSPNGDGRNDIFAIYGGPEVVEIASLKIFDRWGNMVYAAELLPPGGSQGWDGTFKGKPMTPGVYVYIAEVVFLDGENRRLSGEVTIVK